MAEQTPLPRCNAGLISLAVHFCLKIPGNKILQKGSNSAHWSFGGMSFFPFHDPFPAELGTFRIF